MRRHILNKREPSSTHISPFVTHKVLKWICLTNSFEETFEESISISKPFDGQRLPTQFERKAATRNKLKGNPRS